MLVFVEDLESVTPGSDSAAIRRRHLVAFPRIPYLRRPNYLLWR